MISAKVRVCGLIGDPIEQSVSPVMHNAAFSYMGLDYIYLPFRVKKEELAKAIAGIRALNMRGVQCTIPHKVAVITFLDEIDPPAEKIGAINTIVNNNGRLKGYNTDTSGFLKALLDRRIEPQGKKVVVLGAGGASRAISFILAERGADLVILDRQVKADWAMKLSNNSSRYRSRKVKVLELNEDNLKIALKNANILVNATSVGMTPNIGQTPVAKRLLKSDLVVFDIVYNPIRTRLLSEAEDVGAEIIDGLDMLVWQGALAFELWTGVKAPRDIMKAEAMKVLINFKPWCY